jgi:hypothetical protein
MKDPLSSAGSGHNNLVVPHLDLAYGHPGDAIATMTFFGTASVPGTSTPTELGQIYIYIFYFSARDCLIKSLYFVKGRSLVQNFRSSPALESM